MPRRRAAEPRTRHASPQARTPLIVTVNCNGLARYSRDGLGQTVCPETERRNCSHQSEDRSAMAGRGLLPPIHATTVILATATIQSRRGTRPDDPAATGFGAWANYTSDSRQRRHPSRRRRRIAGGEAICTTPVALRGKQKSRVPVTVYRGTGRRSVTPSMGETGISRYAAVLLHREEGAVHQPHGAPVPDRGDRNQGHRPARPPSGGKTKSPGRTVSRSRQRGKWPGGAMHTRATSLLTVTRNGRAAGRHRQGARGASR